MSGEGLNVTDLIPYKRSEEEKKSLKRLFKISLLSRGIDLRKGEKTVCPSRRTDEGELLFISVLPFPFHFYFLSKCLGQTLHC